MFAIDLEQLAPGATAIVDDKSLGFPYQLADAAAGRLLRAGDGERLRAGASLGRQDALAAHERRHHRVLQQRRAATSTATSFRCTSDRRRRDQGELSITSCPGVRRRAGHRVDQARQVPEPDADEVLGPARSIIHASVLLRRATTSIPTFATRRLHARPRPDAAQLLDDAAAHRRPERRESRDGRRERLRDLPAVERRQLSRASSASASSSRRPTSPIRIL